MTDFEFKKGFIRIYQTEVANKRDDPLGHIEYNAKWKCEVFIPCSDTMYSADCLRDIAEGIDRRKEQKK